MLDLNFYVHKIGLNDIAISKQPQECFQLFRANVLDRLLLFLRVHDHQFVGLHF